MGQKKIKFQTGFTVRGKGNQLHNWSWLGERRTKNFRFNTRAKIFRQLLPCNVNRTSSILSPPHQLDAIIRNQESISTHALVELPRQREVQKSPTYYSELNIRFPASPQLCLSLRDIPPSVKWCRFHFHYTGTWVEWKKKNGEKKVIATPYRNKSDFPSSSQKSG